MSKTLQVLNEVAFERSKQDQKWGEQNHVPMLWLAILGEEVGEVNKAALETYFNTVQPGSYVNADADYSGYRTELVQVAAVAVAMIECLDRSHTKPPF